MTERDPSDGREASAGINRRNVLKAASATAAAGVGVAATGGNVAAQADSKCSCFQKVPEGCTCSKFEPVHENSVFNVAGAKLTVLPKTEAGSRDDFDTLKIEGASRICALALKSGSQNQGESCTYWNGESGQLTTDNNKDISNVQVVHGDDCCASVDACRKCPSDLRVKYEYNKETGEFELEGDGDSNVTDLRITERKDGEPVQACFETSYCEVDVSVKAGSGSYSRKFSTISGSQEVCFRGITTKNPQGKTVEHAISNFVVTCPIEQDE